jgi:hypothetical protein
VKRRGGKGRQHLEHKRGGVETEGIGMDATKRGRGPNKPDRDVRKISSPNRAARQGRGRCTGGATLECEYNLRERAGGGGRYGFQGTAATPGSLASFAESNGHGRRKQAGQGVYLCASLYREELVDLRERGAGAASVSFGFPRTRSLARPFAYSKRYARWRHRLLFYTY